MSSPSRPPRRDATPAPYAVFRPRSVERLLRALAGHDGRDDADHAPQARLGSPKQRLPLFAGLVAGGRGPGPRATTRPATTPPAPRPRP
ncbi:hypothetical protein ACFWYW_55955 [Nonomuraea sp. NPDC059023]|uniref:hypothetical protein n=1 Tax=unclassified Nonomuraea TaxID=2593643 RepID=UPI0036B28DDA